MILQIEIKNFMNIIRNNICSCFPGTSQDCLLYIISGENLNHFMCIQLFGQLPVTVLTSHCQYEKSRDGAHASAITGHSSSQRLSFWYLSVTKARPHMQRFSNHSTQSTIRSSEVYAEISVTMITLIAGEYKGQKKFISTYYK